MLKITIFLFILVLVLNAYAQEDTFKPKFSTTISADKGKNLLNQCSRFTPIGIRGYDRLTKQEIEKLEENFKKIYFVKGSDYNSGGIKINNLNDYAYQYLGVRISNKKYIYINAFSIGKKTKNWRTEPFNACDGGLLFWGALFNLGDFSFSQLWINGGG